jgi:hypothetical protein
VPSCIAVVLGCGGARIPPRLRGYEIVVERRDPQAVELARAMQGYGFRVRPAVRGGSRPTAALIFFTFRDPEALPTPQVLPPPGAPLWLHVRLADTRTGVIVGAAMIPLDSVGPDPRARAQAAVRALLANPVPTPP